MKVRLLHPDQDADRTPLPEGAEAQLVSDLALDALFAAMADGDHELLEAARQVVLAAPRNDAATILYRQAVLADCLDNRDAIRQMYTLAVQAHEGARREGFFGLTSGHPDILLSAAVRVVELLCDALRRLRALCAASVARFASAGLRNLCATLERELPDSYFAEVEHELRQLCFRTGVLLSAGLGRAGKAVHVVLREPGRRDRSRLLSATLPLAGEHLLPIDSRDDDGWRAADELRDRGLVLVANALHASARHMASFFGALRFELAFYVGGINLAEKLSGYPRSWPVPLPGATPGLTCRGLVNVALALRAGQPVVGNDVDASGRRLIFITGANRGGKSTFLASVGQAQLMLQAGLFVPAQAFSASLCDAVLTHFLREEDATMRSGKFDEELVRLSALVERVGARALLLFNESFSATNEREGSEVARQIVTALLEHGARVAFVTHLFELTRGLADGAGDSPLFLRAERGAGGQRDFRLRAAAPLATAFAEDLYRQILADVLEPRAAGPGVRTGS